MSWGFHKPVKKNLNPLNVAGIKLSVYKDKQAIIERLLLDNEHTCLVILSVCGSIVYIFENWNYNSQNKKYETLRRQKNENLIHRTLGISSPRIQWLEKKKNKTGFQRLILAFFMAPPLSIWNTWKSIDMSQMNLEFSSSFEVPNSASFPNFFSLDIFVY